MIPWLCNSPTTPLQWVMTNSIPTDKSSKLPKKICYVNSKYILFVTLFQFGIFVSFESKWPIIELSHRVLFDCVFGVSKLLGIFVSKIDIWLIAVAAWDWLVYLSERRERQSIKRCHISLYWPLFLTLENVTLFSIPKGLCFGCNKKCAAAITCEARA